MTNRDQNIEKSRRRRATLVLGVLVLLSGVLVNQWSLATFLAWDGHLDHLGLKRALLAAQVILAGCGAVLIWRRWSLPRGWMAPVLAIPFGLLSALGAFGTIRSLDPSFAEAMRGRRGLMEAEDFVLTLTPRLEVLNQSAANLELPDLHSHDFFMETVRVQGLAEAARPLPGEPLPEVEVTAARWPVAAASRPVAVRDLALWRSFLATVDHFTHAKFFIVRGHFADEGKREWVAEVGFSGHARLVEKSEAQVSAEVEIRWVRDLSRSEEDRFSWRIAEWRTRSFEVAEAPRPLFAEVLDGAVRDPETLRRARTSIHEERLVDYFRDEEGERPHPYFTTASQDRQPGLSVVDLDRDGFDDLYLTARWGKNMFFHNQGDGTFEEIAAELGLDIENHGSSAIFADFDNDGDQDVFLGRTLEQSLYLMNENGRFVDRSDKVAVPLPHLVTAVSAADYDGDGLLDVYFSTYAAGMTFFKGIEGLRPFLSDEQLAEAARRRQHDDYHALLQQTGPPNLLLRNLGDGGFDVAPASRDLEAWLNTFQATWSDFDDDGDVDLYLANDFATNNLYRNDGGRFVDVGEASGAADVGFGMGASWGDYNNDGRQDVYISNMFSKAGTRIIDSSGQEATSLMPWARGNTLLRAGGDGFEDVSSSAEVYKAGWSWGGQFIDVDNDTKLDLYVPSGYYTAPPEIAIPVDV